MRSTLARAARTLHWGAFGALGGGCMRPVRSVRVTAIALLFCASVVPLRSLAQQPASAASSKQLTIDRIYSEPGLNGHLTRGVQWTPDSRQISFFENKSVGSEMKSELWSLEVA